MEPDKIVSEYQQRLENVIKTAQTMLDLSLVKDQTKEPKRLLGQLNTDVCAAGTLMTGFNKAVRPESF